MNDPKAKFADNSALNSHQRRLMQLSLGAPHDGGDVAGVRALIQTKELGQREAVPAFHDDLTPFVLAFPARWEVIQTIWQFCCAFAERVNKKAGSCPAYVPNICSFAQ